MLRKAQTKGFRWARDKVKEVGGILGTIPGTLCCSRTTLVPLPRLGHVFRNPQDLWRTGRPR